MVCRPGRLQYYNIFIETHFTVSKYCAFCLLKVAIGHNIVVYNGASDLCVFLQI